MKTMALFAACALLFGSSGCKKDSSSPAAAGLGNPAAVSFVIGSQPGPGPGLTPFTANPSAGVKITRVILSLPAMAFADTLNNHTPDTIFPAGVAAVLDEYNGVATGLDISVRWHRCL